MQEQPNQQPETTPPAADIPSPPPAPVPYQQTQEDIDRQKLIDANRNQLTMMIVGVMVVTFIGLFIAMSAQQKQANAPANTTSSQPSTTVTPAPTGQPATTAAPAPTTPAQPRVSKDVLDALVAKAQQKGMLKVNVGVHVDRPANATPEQLQAVTENLSKAKNEITMNAFGAMVSPMVERHENMPEMTVTADVEQLKKLAADPNVESLSESQ